MSIASIPPVREPGSPRQRPPAGTCDSHFHVIGPVARFPFAEGRAFTPADVPVEWALHMHERLGIARGVVVQCNPHGTDNSALLDAIGRHPDRLRGVAIVNPAISPNELRDMADAGVRALRFHHLPGASGFSPFGMTAFERLAPVMADLGLHAQFMMDANAIDSAMPYFRDWRLPVMIDHMGSLDAALGATQPAVASLCRLLGEGKIWVKVSAAYRMSTRYPDYDDVRPIHEALVRANPDRIVWGTDWPHTRLAADMPDDGHLLDLFCDWTPDAAVRQKILVDNPARLYRFK